MWCGGRVVGLVEARIGGLAKEEDEDCKPVAAQHEMLVICGTDEHLADEVEQLDQQLLRRRPRIPTEGGSVARRGGGPGQSREERK